MSEVGEAGNKRLTGSGRPDSQPIIITRTLKCHSREYDPLHKIGPSARRVP